MSTDDVLVPLNSHRVGFSKYLIATPLEPCHKKNHADNTKEASNKIDPTDDLFLRQTLRVDSGWREVEEKSHEETNGSPNTAQKTAVPPSSVRGDELSP